MGDWALSTNLYTFAQAQQGFFAWPATGAEADFVRSMKPGDCIVPKFAQDAAYTNDSHAGYSAQSNYCESIGANYVAVLEAYVDSVRAGDAAVPYVLRVLAQREDDTRPDGVPWAAVSVEQEPLAFPLSTKEFLRARMIPPTVAAQFKGSVSPGRHVQGLPTGAGAGIKSLTDKNDRGDGLRRYSLVRATSAEEASDALSMAGRSPLPGDRALAATTGGVVGVLDTPADGGLKLVSKPIPRSPADLRTLFAEAKRKATASDTFTPQNAITAAQELQGLLDGAVDVLPLDDFARWHDRYELLSQKVTQAVQIALRPEPSDLPTASTDESAEEDEPPELEEELALSGLTIEAVRAELPAGMVIGDAVLAEAVTALRAGKHLLLAGPPGTGKTTVAEALARAVMGDGYDVTTATADWTTFDTIGGYLPDPEGGIRFIPGIVLRVLRTGGWLVIDELNRADIDKAFGPLFTLLSGGDSQGGRRAAMPYQDAAGQPVTITWAPRRKGSEGYIITPSWRILGTLNLADKASLFQLSFAFLRRFAVIEIPLPAREAYKELIASLFTGIPDAQLGTILGAAETVAFGPREIGPAIMVDVARYVAKGIEPIGGSDVGAYEDPITALIVAIRLLVVPQYEGAEITLGNKLLSQLGALLPDRADEAWNGLRAALHSVALQ